MSWMQAYRNRLVTVADVDSEIDLLKRELLRPKTLGRGLGFKKELLEAKLSFLSTVRSDLSTPELSFIGIVP